MTVTVSFPPDTDTPGFADENKDKPEETRIISEAAGLHKADEVGSACLHDTLVSQYFHNLKINSVLFFVLQNGKFMSTVGFEGFVQANLCVGMAPFTSWFELVVQV